MPPHVSRKNRGSVREEKKISDAREEERIPVRNTTFFQPSFQRRVSILNSFNDKLRQWAG